MEVITIPCLQDNYSYLIFDEQSRAAALVDPSEAWPATQEIEKNKLKLTTVLCTHHHHDHIGGLDDLLDEYDSLEVVGFHEDRTRIAHLSRLVKEGDRLEICGAPVQVLHTPGHTMTSVTYQVAGHIFVGDTLFGAGCGRLFEGTPAQMLDSLDKIAACPADSRIYFGHEYTAHNLRFAVQLEPGNKAITERAARVAKLRSANLPSAPSTLAEELQTNPFLRSAEPSLISYLKSISHPAGADSAERVEVFAAVRELRNHFS